MAVAEKMKKTSVFVLTKRKERPALRGRHYPGYFRLPSTDEIYDPEKDSIRTIRYAIGETSIYKEDQPEKVTLGDIIFVNGTITVDKTNPNLIKFLQLSNHNEDNKNRVSGKAIYFKKLNPQETAKKSVDSIILESKAVAACLGMNFEKLKGYAKVMSIDTNRSAEEIRHDMILFAKKNPKTFMDGIDDPSIARQSVVNDAVELGILKVEGRHVKWAGGGKGALIKTAPVGVEPVKHLAEWTMEDKDGGDLFDELEKRVAKAKAGE